MSNRVVVTGMGLVSPLGVGVKHCWSRLVSGESGIATVQSCDVTDIPCKIAGEVPESDKENAAALGLLNLSEFIPLKEQKKIGRFVSLSIVAADEALADSGWKPETEEEKTRTGVMVGSGIGSLFGIYESSIALAEKGPRRISPFFIPSCLINLASGNISIRHGLKGPNHSVVTACSTGTHAIGDAANLIRNGYADVMLAGGTESTVCQIGLSGFCAMRALSTSYNDAPREASRPWDEGRDGFVMGEGSGVLVLESYEHAKKRGARIYAEVSGYGLSGDAYHVSAPSEDGDGAFRAMKSALWSANLNPEAIDYINAHGTSTPLGDMVEINAIRRMFSSHLEDVSISSTKSSIGHLLGAAGSVEAIFSILALREGIMPPTLNLETPSEGCEGVDLVPHVAKEKKLNIVLSNSFGFGGTNASLIFKAHD